ncbi:hypothetical protein GPEL0_01r4798 [Geoanaerobacter pelophilus]|uniref:Uncharacterized protein n=1 Tax=Geoanaerobacter pelophilus TaxID=60036 RepID=A0ABQ0MMY9_9BACT|nr:hypothetical protein GPEL0_01r4798 [Geoanaerobacter pelophilus]
MDLHYIDLVDTEKVPQTKSLRTKRCGGFFYALVNFLS